MRNILFAWIAAVPQFRGKHRLVDIARHLLQSPLVCKMKCGFVMELDSFDWTQLELIERRESEPHTIKLICDILEEGDVFVDVGANIGYTALVGRKRVGASGQVIAFEPQPYCCERILRNWELNEFNNLQLHVGAVGEVDDFICLLQQPRTDRSKLSLKYKDTSHLKLNFRIPVCALDSALVEGVRIKLIKIDVEGFELSVLKGAASVLKSVENVLFEALRHDEASSSHVDACVELLVELGFEVFNVYGEPWGQGENIEENNLWAKRVVR